MQPDCAHSAPIGQFVGLVFRSKVSLREVRQVDQFFFTPGEVIEFSAREIGANHIGSGHPYGRGIRIGAIGIREI